MDSRRRGGRGTPFVRGRAVCGPLCFKAREGAPLTVWAPLPAFPAATLLSHG
jgi:hypothetical protein